MCFGSIFVLPARIEFHVIFLIFRVSPWEAQDGKLPFIASQIGTFEARGAHILNDFSLLSPPNLTA
jgi:hypothetical protein